MYLIVWFYSNRVFWWSQNIHVVQYACGWVAAARNWPWECRVPDWIDDWRPHVHNACRTSYHHHHHHHHRWLLRCRAVKSTKQKLSENSAFYRNRQTQKSNKIQRLWPMYTLLFFNVLTAKVAMIADHRGHHQTLPPVREINLETCTPQHLRQSVVRNSWKITPVEVITF